MMQLGQKVRYRTERGWSGTRYHVQMTQAEIDGRERLGVFISVLIGTPVFVLIMALAAGLIK